MFLMPGGARVPVGGYKVVLEYANRLVSDGYDVGIVCPSYCPVKQTFDLLFALKAIIRYALYFLLKWYSTRRWFPLDKRVKEYRVWSLSENRVPRADIYVATAVQTSYYLSQYKNVSPNCKFYFIQHFEDWTSNRDYVLASFRFPLRKWVIAHWLERIVRNEGENCVLIPNGFDFSQFHMTIAPEKREPCKVCMLYHTLEWKGCADGFEALSMVKAQCPELHVILFGVPSRPRNLPDWYEYFQSPSRNLHRKLYNEAAIFVGTSHKEGWGLTIGEAMACGCAVVCTDNQGYLEMAKDRETALVAPVANPSELAKCILRLVNDKALRLRIAYSGNANISCFTWDKSYSILRNEIMSAI